MENNCKSEVVVRLIGKLSLEYPELDQFKVRDIIEETLYKYDIAPQEMGLITSDIDQRIDYYLMMKNQDGLSKNTLKNYEINLRIFAGVLIKPIASVTKEDMRVYIAVRCKDMKPSTRNTQISVLKSFFTWLFDEEFIPRNPMRQIKSTKVPGRLRHALTAEEVEVLSQACKDVREQALVEFLTSSGCRLSEVISIKTKDIDWHEMSLNVVGKGNKERKVYFNVKTKILLKKYLKQRKGDSPYLFVSVRAPYGQLTGRSVEAIISKIAKRAGFDKAVYPHLCRHSFATHSLNAGMSLPVLQKLMGHNNADTTMIYAELSQENIAHEYRRIC